MKKNNLFMKPGKNNMEDRRNFVKFWVRYMKSVSDEDWSRGQAILIDSQLQSARDFYNSLEKDDERRNILLKFLRKKSSIKCA